MITRLNTKFRCNKVIVCYSVICTANEVSRIPQCHKVRPCGRDHVLRCEPVQQVVYLVARVIVVLKDVINLYIGVVIAEFVVDFGFVIGLTLCVVVVEMIPINHVRWVTEFPLVTIIESASSVSCERSLFRSPPLLVDRASCPLNTQKIIEIVCYVMELIEPRFDHLVAVEIFPKVVVIRVEVDISHICIGKRADLKRGVCGFRWLLRPCRNGRVYLFGDNPQVLGCLVPNKSYPVDAWLVRQIVVVACTTETDALVYFKRGAVIVCVQYNGIVLAQRKNAVWVYTRFDGYIPLFLRSQMNVLIVVNLEINRHTQSPH